MSITSLAKVAKVLRYPIILENQKVMLEDRYRMIQTNTSRGEMFNHDGAISNADGSGIKAQYVQGCDGYDIVVFTNTASDGLLDNSILAIS